MGTTANYSWPYPESSDYVADGATAIENLADAIDTTVDGLGSWSNFTPSYVNFSATTLQARYAEINNVTFIEILAELTSSVSATMFIDNMPVNAAVSSQETNLYAIATDLTGSLAHQSMKVDFSGFGAIRFYGSVDGSSSNGSWQSSRPFGWASGDYLRVRGFYRS